MFASQPQAIPSTVISFTATLLLGLSLFVATNVDDILILIAFYADPQFRPTEVTIGQCAGIGALVLLSILAALISVVIPTMYVGLLGLAPVALGIRELVRLWGPDNAEASGGEG